MEHHIFPMPKLDRTLELNLFVSLLGVLSIWVENIPKKNIGSTFCKKNMYTSSDIIFQCVVLSLHYLFDIQYIHISVPDNHNCLVSMYKMTCTAKIRATAFTPSHPEQDQFKKNRLSYSCYRKSTWALLIQRPRRQLFGPLRSPNKSKVYEIKKKRLS